VIGLSPGAPVISTATIPGASSDVSMVVAPFERSSAASLTVSALLAGRRSEGSLRELALPP
jgi:hypothetical protein